MAKVKTDPSMTNPNLMPWHDMNERQVQATASRYTGTPKKAPRDRRDIPYGVGSKAGPPDKNTKKPDQAQSEYNADRREYNQDRPPPNRGDVTDFPLNPSAPMQPAQQQSIDQLIQQLLILRSQSTAPGTLSTEGGTMRQNDYPLIDPALRWE